MDLIKTSIFAAEFPLQCPFAHSPR